MPTSSRPAHLVFVVSENCSGFRLDKFLADCLPERSRAYVQRLIQRGLVTLNGEQVKAHHTVKEGDVAEVVVPPPEEPYMEPQDIPLEVLYEDEYLIAVNKPAGLVVHPGAGNPSGTLVNALLAHCEKLSTGGHPLRPGIVHRLDKDTSGCIIVAKDDVTHRRLADQFLTRQVHKEYRAIVVGSPPDDRGVIETHIARSRRNRKKMTATAAEGKFAFTSYCVLENFFHASYLSIEPLTGRTHQIRVHLSHIGHPVAGDRQYSRGSTCRQLGIEIPRQMLHSYKLHVNHPHNSKRMRLTAPLPKDFSSALNQLRRLKELH
ncbi:RluA family pseudouridine synthase [bacterium]|nr:RluA family pseudouridine synthase [bacterium]